MSAIMLAFLLAAPPAQATLPTPAEAAEGWIALFDGETAAGWGGATVKDGALVILAGGTVTYAVPLPDVEFHIRIANGRVALAVRGANISIENPPMMAGSMRVDGNDVVVDFGIASVRDTGAAANRPIRFALTNGGSEPASVASIWVRPIDAKPIFNGRDLAGWQLYKGRRQAREIAIQCHPAG